MNETRLSTEQTASYRDNGFLVAPGLITPAEVERLKAETTRFCRGAYDVPGIEPSPPDETDQEALAKYLCIHQPHKVSAVMEAFVRHPKVAEALTQIIGPNVKCMQSMLFIKPPGFPGQAYHQDERYIPTEDRSLTGAWIALDDATVENGCLWVIPGTHKEEIYPWAPHDNPEYDSADEAQGVPREREIPVEVKAGDVVFFNGYLLHSSRRNRSNVYRRVLVSHYMSAESVLRWQGREDYRDVILVAGCDPHAEKGTDEIARPHLRSLRR
jgi:phytanoyl-CoA hydroxylase